MKKEKCVWLVCILLCFSSMVEGQTITVENGIAISSLRKSDYDNRVCPYQIAVGYEYADKGWFNLSSSIGYLKKGGKMHLNIYEDLSSVKSKYPLPDIEHRIQSQENVCFRCDGICRGLPPA